MKTAFHMIEASIVFLKYQAMDQDNNPQNPMNESNVTLVAAIAELSDTYIHELVTILTLLPWADTNEGINSMKAKPFNDRVLRAFITVS